MFRRRQLVLLMIASACSVARAQEPDPCLRRTVVVNAVDDRGSPVNGLAIENFRVETKGQELKLLSVAERQLSGRVVILLDMSGSMMEPPRRWQLMLATTEALVSRLPTDTPLALLSFTTMVRERVGFEGGRRVVLERLAAYRRFDKQTLESRRTALLDSILEALKLLGPIRTGDAIVAVSDGGENASQVRWGMIRDALRNEQVRFFSLLPSVNQPAAPEEVSGPHEVAELSAATGGWSLMLQQAPAAAAVGGWFDIIPRGYVLEIELAQTIEKPRKWKLTIFNEHGKKLGYHQVLYPRKLVPCPATSDDGPAR